METKEIEIASIRVSALNTRKDMEAGTEDAGLDDLANSIRSLGLINPVTVVERSEGQFDLIAGQRRLLACRRIGMTTISAIVRTDLEDSEATVISLVENVQRADMNPMDKAKGYQRIQARYEDLKRVAQETGVTVPTIRRYLLLLDLAPSIQDCISTANGPAGIGSLSLLPQFFLSWEDQKWVLMQIGSFPIGTQVEILRRSGGNRDLIPGLTEDALEGVFSLRTCRDGLCFDLPEEFKLQLAKPIKENNVPAKILPSL